MTEPRKIRGSSIDSLMGCAASVLSTSGIRIGSSGDSATIGLACHSAAASIVTSGAYDMEVVASRYGLVDEQRDEVSRLAAYANKAWTQGDAQTGPLSQFFPEPRVELHLEGPALDVNGVKYQLTGTLDLCSPHKGTNQAVLLDWKSGRIEVGHHQQMTCYAYLIWDTMGRPDDTVITGIIVYLRQRYWRVLRWDAAALAGWEWDLMHNVLPRPDQYRIGRHCEWCEIRSTCKARSALVSGTLSGLDQDKGWMADSKSVLDKLTPENRTSDSVEKLVNEITARIKLAEQAASDARDLLRATVQRVGSLPLDKASDMYVTVSEMERRTLKPAQALAVLGKYLSDSEVRAAMKISLPKVLDCFARQRRRALKEGGTMTERRERLLQELADGDAVTTTTTSRMQTTTLTKKELESENESRTSA